MGVGHIAAGLALARMERRVNAALFVAAALLLDALLWLFVLAGWEHVVIPPDYAATHQPHYVFPWSHGLAASLVWSALAALAALGWSRGNRRAALLLAAAVFSHWLLDALVHRPELPLAGPASPLLGLSLWDTMPLALAIEGALALAGLLLFLRGSGLPRGRAAGLALLVVVALGSTISGMTIAPPPPSVPIMAATSLATLVIVCALVAWLARPPALP